MSSATIGSRVRSWLGGSNAPNRASETEKTAVADNVSSQNQEKLHGLERRLRELVSLPQLLAAGRVHMVNLDTLRERLGDDWPALSERVHTAADRIIKRHLTDRDVHFRSGDDEYIIVFAVSDKDAARLLCGKITEDIYRLFLGDVNLKDVKISTAVGTFNGQMVYQHASIGEILHFINSESKGGGRPVSLGDENGENINAGDTTREDSSRADEHRRLHLAHYEVDRVKNMYRPVWDVERQVITTYMCTPIREFPDGSAVEGAAALDVFSDPQRLAEINTTALIEAVETLDELFRNKFRLMVSVPVCFETLATRRTRQDYIDVCRSIPDYLRRFVAFEFFRFAPGVPNGRMTDLVNELRPFCRWTFLRVDLKQVKFANLVGTGLTGVSALIPADRNLEARTMEDMNAFAMGAERADLRTCAVGIASTSLALAARGAGMTFITGDLIGHADEIPQNMLRFNWQDLFKRGVSH